jgi:hypothetical protein
VLNLLLDYSSLFLHPWIAHTDMMHFPWTIQQGYVDYIWTFSGIRFLQIQIQCCTLRYNTPQVRKNFISISNSNFQYCYYGSLFCLKPEHVTMKILNINFLRKWQFNWSANIVDMGQKSLLGTCLKRLRNSIKTQLHIQLPGSHLKPGSPWQLQKHISRRK